ncbi:MAG: hypothetical protein COV60_00575 [Candidatus Magasanikbacteria bacterium CG11_big_fil_rev_8_21_14_0_20_43_7]|uniref:DOT1 domain-containing protein n=1 Tax=Candidatus Magasanikbacteria bacterium CG11_big_fil_rev_8_21_14_0_20_43_7 TaxID=1974654 RepID=A0A2H0N3B8_9BACT|nr:MAG: hypothetical protein COV60_00575 [Candidatus Magasanikbacteria bacterium CG11_big_fil_rev_8_21_14_0_20_43_7]
MIVWILLACNIALIVVIAIFFVWNVYAIVRGAPYVPSSRERIQTMKKIADLRKTDVVLDVGSGDGRVLRAVADVVREARGIEINPILVWWSRVMNHLCGFHMIHIVQKDFWKQDITDVDVLFVYCIDSKMIKFEKKVLGEMKSGAKVLSNGFSLPSRQPTYKERGIFLYVL